MTESRTQVHGDEPVTAATVKIRNLIVSVHAGDEAVTVSVWSEEERAEDPIKTIEVRYDALVVGGCGTVARRSYLSRERNCCGDPNENCVGCPFLYEDRSKRVAPYNEEG